MQMDFKQTHRHFFGEIDGVDLSALDAEEDFDSIRAAMDRYAVVVFHGQDLSNQAQLDFARRLDGELHSKTGGSVIQKNRYGDEALADISNISADGEIFTADARRRLYSLGNRLWHTDASFVDPAGRYSMLYAVEVPPVPADTEFADMRAAFDALPDATKAELDGLNVRHSLAHSRQTLGFDFSPEEKERLVGAIHPLIRTLSRAGRRSLYLASHASEIIGRSLPEGRLLLRDLMEHATRPEFVHRHVWRDGDLVIWDNRATMHRACPFDDTRYRREMRRVTTLDLALPPYQQSPTERFEKGSPRSALDTNARSI